MSVHSIGSAVYPIPVTLYVPGSDCTDSRYSWVIKEPNQTTIIELPIKKKADAGAQCSSFIVKDLAFLWFVFAK